MPDALNLNIALAKQAYDELVGIRSVADLERDDFGSGPARERVAELLKKLNLAINAIRRCLAEHVSESPQPPVLTLPAPHRAFYNDVILRHGKALQAAYLEITGLSILAGLLDAPTDEPRRPVKLNAISWGLERWRDMLDDDELEERYDRGFDIEGAQDLVDMPWFQPDRWTQNLKFLDPVLLDRPTHVLRDHVRYRLTEIYRAFAYGLWMAAIALSRSLVDFALRTNAPRLGVATTYVGAGGRTEDKSLKQLDEEVASKVESLARPIETVRETGNRILHPKKHDIIAHPKVMRSEALDCIRAARSVVETLYSDVGGGK